MKRIATIATLLVAAFVSAAPPAKAGPLVRGPVAPARTGVPAASPSYRPIVGPRVYARSGASYGYGVPYRGPISGYGRGMPVGFGRFQANQTAGVGKLASTTGAALDCGGHTAGPVAAPGLPTSAKRQ
jgi:hypothetical protein